MPTDTPSKDVKKSAPTDALRATNIFRVLAHDRRRYVLYYLSRRVGAVSLGDLAEQITLWEDNPTSDWYERVLTDLYHTHLPMLAESGLITYDLDRETVTLLETIEAVTPYLELAAGDDIRSQPEP